EVPIASVPVMGMVDGGVVALLGIGLAYLLHLRDRGRAEWLARALRPFATLLDHKFWVDEIYQAAIVTPLRAIGRFLYALDRILVDGLINLLTAVPQFAGF